MKKLRIVKAILLAVLIFSVCWNLAFILISYTYGHFYKQLVWNDLLKRAHTMTALTEKNGKDMESSLKEYASLNHDRLIWVDSKGAATDFSMNSEQAVSELKQADIDQALQGNIIRSYHSFNPLHPGLATVGVPFKTYGQTNALFIQTPVPNLFADYWKQSFTQLLATAFLFSLAFFKGPRQREVALFKAMVDAMRRMAKGDFNVNLEHNKRHVGQFGELIDGINHMAVELHQMEQMRQEFVSNVSHEIQSPLTSIGGFSRALQNEELTREDRMHYLGIIETETSRLSKLSDNLLKLTSLESQHHPFEPKAYRLDKQLRNIILACEPQWLDKAMEMDIALEVTDIVADEDLMSQVWINLIHNGIKFTPSGGTIGVHLQLRGKEAIVRIWDTGVGIAAEDQSHIFERFFKADKSRNRINGGSGLGLSIVSKIIEMHQGTIRVESKLGEGASFVITLPTEDPQTK